MTSRVVEFARVDEFYIDTPFDNPDNVHVSLVVVDDQGEKGVIKFNLDGDITYPDPNGNDLTLPLAEDFLTQFAASMGYGVTKD